MGDAGLDKRVFNMPAVYQVASIWSEAKSCQT
jgi:hypothetical protein